MSHPTKRRRVSNSEADQDAASVAFDLARASSDVAQNPADKIKKSRSLFVRSLPASATTASLTNYFSQTYPIKHATAVVDPATNACKGFGFVTFTEWEDAQRALEDLNGTTFEGRKIKIEVAEPRHRELEEGPTGQRSRRNIPKGAALEAKAKREAEKVDYAPPKLIIRNLPWSIKDSSQLSTLFQSYGKIKHATVPSKNGKLAGFGFIVMRGRKNAEKALEALNGAEIDGRTLAVDWAVDKEIWQGQESKQELSEAGSGIDEDADPDDIASHMVDTIDDEDFSESSERGTDDEDDDDDLDAGEDDMEDLSDDEDAQEDRSFTIFIRNLPFTSSDETLREKFSSFGPVRYARIVLDPNTERPRGTGFVCFFNSEDARKCLRNAPKHTSLEADSKAKKVATPKATIRSVLQNESDDPSGEYTMEGRVLQISQAVDKNQAIKLTELGHEYRNKRDGDKRRLYLLSEGTISSKTALYKMLSPSEIAMREASAKQRKSLIKNNPSLHVSLTRLSVRNIPRSVTSKDLKSLAREAVVEFAKDVKAGRRQKLSKEELIRGGDAMRDAEKGRKRKGVGIVKQTKVVFEGREGAKVTEHSGAGRSRGYGFIEFHTHRSALMGLRWLNGHAIDPKKYSKSNKAAGTNDQDRKKRLIVEFAIENAQVVRRRSEREDQSRDKPQLNRDKRVDGSVHVGRHGPDINGRARNGKRQDFKQMGGKRKLADLEVTEEKSTEDKEKLANRQSIIGRKRVKKARRNNRA